MTSKKQKIVGIILGILALFGVSSGIENFGGVGDSSETFSNLGTTGTSGAMTLGISTSQQVLATSSSRIFAQIANLSNAPIFCSLDNDKAAVAYSGVMIATSSTLIIDSELPYTGAVRCISPGRIASTSVYSAQ